jgi:hypothetical protein
MDSPAISAPPQFSGIEEYAALPLGNDHAEATGEPQGSNRAARGAVTGILLGASLWAVILILVGVIKL